MIERFNKKPGQWAVHEFGDGSGILTPDPPDDIRLPDHLGGHVEPVQLTFVQPCLYCQSVDNFNHDVTTYELVSVVVQECLRVVSEDGATGTFFWLRKEGLTQQKET
mgnify:CR=1 FL=1